jgi:hypothetical protein
VKACLGQGEDWGEWLDGWIFARQDTMEVDKVGMVAWVHDGRVMGDERFRGESGWWDGSDLGSVGVESLDWRVGWTGSSPTSNCQVNFVVLVPP